MRHRNNNNNICYKISKNDKMNNCSVYVDVARRCCVCLYLLLLFIYLLSMPIFSPVSLQYIHLHMAQLSHISMSLRAMKIDYIICSYMCACMSAKSDKKRHKKSNMVTKFIVCFNQIQPHPLH